MGLSIASRALDALMDEASPEGEAVRKTAHRTVLWRYRTGKGKPGADLIAKLYQASGGRIPADGWQDDHPEEQVPDTEPVCP